MPDEELPEKEDILGPAIPLAQEPPKEKEPAGPTFKEELPEVPDLQTFWSSIASQVSVKVTSQIDPPEQFGETTSFTGNISFQDFKQSGHPFSGDAVLIHGLYKDVPNASLVLPIGGILSAVATVVKEYTKRGEKISNVIRSAGEALPSIFEAVFKAIKDKSEKIHWSKKDPTWAGKGEPIPIVQYVYDAGLDKDLGVNLVSTFEGMKSAINEEAEKILKGGKGRSEKKEKSPLLRNRYLLRDFVINKIPKDAFKPLEEHMYATLTMSEVEKLGGKEVVDILRATPAVGAHEFHETGDVHDFWYRYYPDKDKVLFENKRLTDKKVLERVQKIWENYGGGTPQDLFKAISGDKEVGQATVVKWFSDQIRNLTPDIQGKVMSLFGLGSEKSEEGIKKLAYPSQAWAGPSLDQVGTLVGDAQAKWASELAGSLAAKFDYISYPKLGGGPSDLKKLATLPLSPAQIARVERNRAPALKIMEELYGSRPAYDTEDFNLQMPLHEEMDRLAEDTLLELAESTPSSMPDEEFLKELRHELMKVISKVHAKPHTKWPSTKAGPEDALQGDNPSFNTVTEAPEEVEMHKTALMHEQDAVQVVPNHPDIPAEFYGRLGKIHDVKGDIYVCPEHGPEPFIRYLIELEGGYMMWFREDELMSAGSSN